MTEGVAITPFQVTTSGGEGPITFSLSGAPSGISIDPTTGALTMVPGEPVPVVTPTGTTTIDPRGKFLYLGSQV